MGTRQRAVESMVIDPIFWARRRVLITGHTGFKGAWLTLWLERLGAQVTGFALEPPTNPSLFEVVRVGNGIQSLRGDVRDLGQLTAAVSRAEPEVIIHMAAQSLVRASYADPVGTYATNVMGTVNILEAVRSARTVRVIINVTSDKCYENRERAQGYREDEAMGGSDPYSSSKGCSELVTAAYRRSFFSGQREPIAVASARAGNVVGGGDWAADRLVPDLFRAIKNGNELVVRHPSAVRPWQYVLEPLCGYLMLAQAMWRQPAEFADAWNFGPRDEDAWPVARVLEALIRCWGSAVRWSVASGAHPHEAHFLKLDCSKARTRLGWQPRITLEAALDRTAAWHRAYLAGADMRATSLEQIASYERLLAAAEQVAATPHP